MVQATADPVREQIRAMLLSDMSNVVLGVITIAAGLTAASFYRARARGTRDPGLIWFSLFAILYGGRLLIQTGAVPFVTGIPLVFFFVT